MRIVLTLFIFILLIFIAIRLISNNNWGTTTNTQVNNAKNQKLADPKKDFTNIELIYSTNNGSLPPPYHRERVLTLSQSNTGLIKGELAVSDYSKVLEKKSITVSPNQFKKLVTDALNLEKASGSLAGCTGGKSKSVKISQAGNILLEAASYACAGQSTNKSLDEFSTEIEQIISQSN